MPVGAGPDELTDVGSAGERMESDAWQVQGSLVRGGLGSGQDSRSVECPRRIAQLRRGLPSHRRICLLSAAT
jgi:hypothetical protein